MVVWRLRACPRCGGDRFVDRDADGWYEQCLQCGHRRAVTADDKVGRVPGGRGPYGRRSVVL